MAGGHKQIIVLPAGVPGAVNSVFSAKKTSPTIAATTGTYVIPDVGMVQFLPLIAGFKLQIQDPLATWTDLTPAGGADGKCLFCDGTNIRIANTVAAGTVSYYVTQ